MTEKVRLHAADDDKPYALLEPVVAELLRRGNRLTRRTLPDSSFGPSPEGYIAVLEAPVDWEHVVGTFELPRGVRYDAVRDVIYDDVHWTAVYGSSGKRAASAP